MYNKVGVYFLFQPDEIMSTLDWLKWVSPQCSENIQLFGIVNGYLGSEWKEKLDKIDFLDITYSERNRGVAGGRNIVISRAMEWGADLLISLDNDILVPQDYFSRMVSEYSKLKAFKPNLGIITPTIFDINRLIKLYGIEELKTLFLENSSIKSRENLLEKRDELSKEDYFYHLGVSGWKGCYLVSPLFDKFYRSKRFEETVLSQNGNKDKYKFVWHRSEKRIRDGIIDGRIEYLKADTLPGGLHVFESNYIQTYGQFDERFNPYGFEDSELCIRGVEDGLEHYLVRSVFVAHDLDQRFENRAPSVTFFTRGKVRRILMNRHIKDVGEKLYLLYDTFVLFPMAIFQSSNEKIEKKLQYCFNLYYGFLFVPRRRFIESFLRLFNRGTSQR